MYSNSVEICLHLLILLDYGNQQPYINQEYATTPQAPNYSYNNVQNYPAGTPILQPTQMGGVFGQPIVQDMAFQYGQQVKRNVLKSSQQFHM